MGCWWLVFDCLTTFTQINTAVKFLQNPKVVSSADSHKRAFLKNKGLGGGFA